MGATLRAPIAGSSQMLESIGAAVNPDVHVDVLVSEVGIEVRPTQPPHPLRIVDVPSGYPEDLETFGMPDTVEITDILSVDVKPLASYAHATSCLDMSVAASMSVDFDDRMREIQNTATSEFVDDASSAYHPIRNPSLAPNVGHASLGDPASGTHLPTAQGHTCLGDTASGILPTTAMICLLRTSFGPLLLDKAVMLTLVLIF